MLFRLKPDLIIECGTADGGSALYLATICDLVGKGKVITIDIIDTGGRPRHKRIEYLLGSSTSEDIFSEVAGRIRSGDVVMVILDSDHSKEHVLEELNMYSRLVTTGSYLVVEDTDVNGNPVLPEFGPGPGEAVTEFLRNNSDFEADRSMEKFYMTFSPGGYLLRVR